MEEKRPFSKRESFVIRLWQRSSEPDHWLGQIQHVSTGETAVIHNLAELTAVIETLLINTQTKE